MLRWGCRAPHPWRREGRLTPPPARARPVVVYRCRGARLCLRVGARCDPYHRCGRGTKRTSHALLRPGRSALSVLRGWAAGRRWRSSLRSLAPALPASLPLALRAVETWPASLPYPGLNRQASSSHALSHKSHSPRGPPQTRCSDLALRHCPGSAGRPWRVSTTCARWCRERGPGSPRARLPARPCGIAGSSVVSRSPARPSHVSRNLTSPGPVKGLSRNPWWISARRGRSCFVRHDRGLRTTRSSIQLIGN